MASYVYADGKYHMLANNKIAKDGELLAMKHTDRVVVNGEDYPLGVATADVQDPSVPVIPDAPEPTLKSLVHEQGDEPTGGTTWYVTPDGAGNMDGTSWANAVSQSSIQVVLLSAVSGDRVYFMEGTYDSITRPITLPFGLSLYGGFSSTDTSWSARDAFAHQTIWQPSGFTGTFAEVAEAVEGQVIDGFTLIGYIDTSSDGANLTYKNMTVNGGEFKTLGNLYNCQFVDCALTTNDAEKVIVSSTEAKNMTVTGNLANGAISLTGGTLTCDGVSNSYIVEGNIVSNGAISESNIINMDAVTNVTGDVNSSTVYGKVNVSARITECDIYGDVTCHGSITGKADKNIITGDIICRYTIKNYVCEGYVEAHIVENCVLRKITTASISRKSVCTTEEYADFSADVSGWKQDSSVRCDYYIQQGFLYYVNGKQVGTQRGWTAVSGYSSTSSTSSTSSYYAYGICNGKLYRLSDTTATLINTVGSGWTAVSGYSSTAPSNSDYCYAYGIRNGMLYRLHSGTVFQINTGGSGWTAVIGYSHSFRSDYCHAYGICNGQLYALMNSTASLMDTGTSGWTAVSGYSRFDSSTSSKYYAYGIRNGMLYWLYSGTVSRIYTGGSGWTAVSGYSSDSDYYAYGICNGQLYALLDLTATLINTGGSGWTAVSGYSSTSSCYAYGICNEELYRLSDTTATRIGMVGSGWTAVSGHYSDYCYAHGICNGMLYLLYSLSVDRIGPYIYNSIMMPTNCSFLNSTQPVSTATNCEFINCENENLVESSANFCTFTNCKGSVPSGTYNIFWNCTGTIPSANNTQSTYYADDLVPGGLGTDNTIARFKNTGFAPAQGMQDVGQPPSPITDPTGYQNWIDQFGDFQPASNSFLKGRAPLDSTVTTDIAGTTRLDPTTPGAYETAEA